MYLKAPAIYKICKDGYSVFSNSDITNGTKSEKVGVSDKDLADLDLNNLYWWWHFSSYNSQMDRVTDRSVTFVVPVCDGEEEFQFVEVTLLGSWAYCLWKARQSWRASGVSHSRGITWGGSGTLQRSPSVGLYLAYRLGLRPQNRPRTHWRDYIT